MRIPEPLADCRREPCGAPPAEIERDIMRPHPGRAIMAGFAATAVMSVVMYMLVCILAGRLVDSAMLGGAAVWMPAVVLHFVNGGITLPLIYVYVVFRFLPGEPWIRGAMWGFVLWCLAEIIVMPLMNDAVSRTPSAGASAIAPLGLLLAHLMYGALLGWLAAAEPPQPSRLAEIEGERLAA